MTQRKLLVILGPTATGKTDLALQLAKKFNGELVSCDSRQVYRGLDIGTGKLPRGDSRFKIKDSRIKRGKSFWEIDGVRIWMYDVVDVNTQYTVADYVKDAEKVIKGIREKGKLPIIVGGTGLYLKAYAYGLSNLNIPVDKKLREELEKLTLAQLQEKLRILSPVRWKNLNDSDRQNLRRLLRSIEIIIMNPYIQTYKKDNGIGNKSDLLKIGLTAPREVLYKNADLSVLSRINKGMIEETKKLYKNGLSIKRMKQLGLEYGVLADYLERETSKEELIKKLQGKIHGYIRRQLTWFKKDEDINWFDIAEKDYIEKIEKLVSKW